MWFWSKFENVSKWLRWISRWLRRRGGGGGVIKISNFFEKSDYVICEWGLYGITITLVNRSCWLTFWFFYSFMFLTIITATWNFFKHMNTWWNSKCCNCSEKLTKCRLQERNKAMCSSTFSSWKVRLLVTWCLHYCKMDYLNCFFWNLDLQLMVL